MEFDRFKLFVGGISRETSEEALRQHFSKYGIVLGAAVARERVTGNSRGFGFVRFSDSSAVNKALGDTHVISDRTVEVKKAVPRHEQQKIQQYGSELRQYSSLNEVSNIGNYRTKKVFVGGLSSNITEEEFKKYFEKFGRITDVVVMHDSVTNRPRGFGFVTFDSEDSVENVMQNNFHELSNKRVEVKRAIPKEGIQTSNGNYTPRFDVRTMPTYNSFRPTAFAPERPGFGMVIRYAPPPPLIGYHGVQGFHHYPIDMYGFGYPFPNMPWNNTIMPTTGIFYPPRNDAPGYFPYVNGFGHPGMNSAGYNSVVWPALDDGFEQVNVDMITPGLETLKLDVTSHAHMATNGNAAVKPLDSDAYR